MHLKLDSSGIIDDGDVARDLGQEPADIVVLSAADSDLAAFGAAHATLGEDFPGVRLTNLLALGHPASVDLYVERTLCRAKVVVLRMLGGESYWPHGVEGLRTDALRRGAFECGARVVHFGEQRRQSRSLGGVVRKRERDPRIVDGQRA